MSLRVTMTLKAWTAVVWLVAVTACKHSAGDASDYRTAAEHTLAGNTLLRSRRDIPDVCMMPMEVGGCRGRYIRYYYNAETSHCERFQFGGCGGNANHFHSLLACLWTCERHVMPPVQNRVGEYTSGFCDAVCARGCSCSGTAVQCSGPLVTPPRVTTDCARTLDLSNSGLQMLRNDSFSRLPSLTTLDLSGNSLRYIPINAFRGLSSLKVLRLSRNQLVKLPALALQHLPALEDLDMSDNQLSFLACETIDNLPELRMVNVSNNKLRRLVAHQGVPLEQMTIDVRNNQLLSLRFPSLQGMPHLYLAGNPLQCGCGAQGMLKMLATDPSRVLDSPACGGPISRAGLALTAAMDLTEEDLCVQKDISADTLGTCMSKPVIGPCRALLRRYYYNNDNQRCEAFTYGGCLGTRNNFASLLACQYRCEVLGSRPTGDPITTTVKAVSVTTCPPGEEFSDCGSPCQRVCNATAQERCSGLCVEGCYCRADYMRLYEDGPCIKKDSWECRGADSLPTLAATMGMPVTEPATPPPMLSTTSPTTEAPEPQETQPSATTPQPVVTTEVIDKDRPDRPSWPSTPYDRSALQRLQTVLYLPAAPEGVTSSYNIELRVGNGQWRTIRMASPSSSVSALNLPDILLSPGQVYRFRLQTIAGSSYSEYSDTVSFRAPTSRPNTEAPPPPATTPPTVRTTALRTAPPTQPATAGTTAAPTRPSAPIWPFPPSGSVGPDYIDLNLPALTEGIIELFQRLPGRGFAYVSRYPATGRVETRRIPAEPNLEYSFIIRHVVRGLPSRRSNTIMVETLPADGDAGTSAEPSTTEAPYVPQIPRWPSQDQTSTQDTFFGIILPTSPIENLRYDVYIRSPSGGFRLYNSFAASTREAESVHAIEGLESSTEYELVFRTRLGQATSTPSSALYVTTRSEFADTTSSAPSPTTPAQATVAIPTPAHTPAATDPATTLAATLPPATTPQDARPVVGDPPMWIASVVVEPEKQSPEVITMVLPAIPQSQIDQQQIPVEYVVFARSLQPIDGWTPWQPVVSAPITIPEPVTVRITDVKPLTEYQFRFRTETANQVSPFSSIVTYRTPAIGTPVWPQPPINFARSTPTSAVINLPKVVASQRGFVRQYTVFYRVADGNGNFDGPFLSRGGSIGGDQSEYELDGLPGGSALQVVVEAINATAVSPRSAVVQLQLPVEPIVPQWVKFPIDEGASTSELLTLLMPKVHSTDQEFIDSYTVQIRQVDEEAWSTHAENVDPFAVTTTIENLQPGATVVVRVVPVLTAAARRQGYRASPSTGLEVDLPEATTSPPSLTTQPTTGIMRPTRYSMQWSISRGLRELVKSLRVEYRQRQADGRFGSWLAGSGQLAPEADSFNLVFVESGVYEVRTGATLVDDTLLDVAGPFTVNTANLLPLAAAPPPSDLEAETDPPSMRRARPTSPPPATAATSTSPPELHFPLLQPGANDGVLVWSTSPVQSYSVENHRLRLNLPSVPLEYQSADYHMAVEYAVASGNTVFSEDWLQSSASVPIDATEHVLSDSDFASAGAVQVRVLVRDQSGGTVASSAYLVTFLRLAAGQAAGEPGRLNIRLATEGIAERTWRLQVRSYEPDMLGVLTDGPTTQAVRVPVVLPMIMLRFEGRRTPREVTGVGDAESARQSFVVDTSLLPQS